MLTVGKNGFQKQHWEDFNIHFNPRTAGAVCVADAEGSASRSRDLTPAIPAFSLPPLPWLSPRIFRNLPTTFCPKHNAKKCCCLGIFLTPEKAGKEIEIKITRQEESSLKRTTDSACAEGAFDALCLCATRVFAWLCVMRLLCLPGVGSTTCSRYTWQRWTLTPTAAGNCCHRVSKSRRVCGAPVASVSFLIL